MFLVTTTSLEVGSKARLIDDIITNMDDMDYVIKVLQMNAHSHCQRFLHFDAKFFWVCCEFLPFLVI